jgi:hypothetical protein
MVASNELHGIQGVEVIVIIFAVTVTVIVMAASTENCPAIYIVFTRSGDNSS